MLRNAVLACVLLAVAVLPVAAEIPAMVPPLHWAARYGQVEIARMLIASGTKVDSVDALGRTPLHVGVEHPEIVELLLESGASVDPLDSFHNTPLHRAVRFRRSVELLLEYGADVSVKNAFRKTPLELSMRNGASRRNVAIIQLLIAAGAQ